jgi:hypothetical protein
MKEAKVEDTTQAIAVELERFRFDTGCRLREQVNSPMAIPTYTTRRHTSQVRSDQTSKSDAISQHRADVQLLKVDAREFTEDLNEIALLERFMQFTNEKLAGQPTDCVEAMVSPCHC